MHLGNVDYIKQSTSNNQSLAISWPRRGDNAVFVERTNTVGIVTAAVVALVAGAVAAAVVASVDNVTLVIVSRNIYVGGGDAEDEVEFVSLNSGIDGSGVGSDVHGTGANRNSGAVCLANVRELIADRLADNVNVISRTVGVGF